MITTESKLKSLDQILRDDGTCYEHVVALVVHGGVLILATERELYRIDGTRLTKLLFETETT